MSTIKFPKTLPKHRLGCKECLPKEPEHMLFAPMVPIPPFCIKKRRNDLRIAVYIHNLSLLYTHIKQYVHSSVGPYIAIWKVHTMVTPLPREDHHWILTQVSSMPHICVFWYVFAEEEGVYMWTYEVNIQLTGKIQILFKLYTVTKIGDNAHHSCISAEIWVQWIVFESGVI